MMKIIRKCFLGSFDLLIHQIFMEFPYRKSSCIGIKNILHQVFKKETSLYTMSFKYIFIENCFIIVLESFFLSTHIFIEDSRKSSILQIWREFIHKIAFSKWVFYIFCIKITIRENLAKWEWKHKNMGISSTKLCRYLFDKKFWATSRDHNFISLIFKCSQSLSIVTNILYLIKKKIFWFFCIEFIVCIDNIGKMDHRKRV